MFELLFDSILSRFVPLWCRRVALPVALPRPGRANQQCITRADEAVRPARAWAIFEAALGGGLQSVTDKPTRYPHNQYRGRGRERSPGLDRRRRIYRGPGRRLRLLCQAASTTPDSADVWNVRRRWPGPKAKLPPDLLHGKFGLSPLRRIHVNGEAIELWTAPSF
jgi:hypothetical protein